MPDSAPPNGDHGSAGPAFRAHPTHWIAPDEIRLRAQSLFEGIPLFSQVPLHHLRELARFARSESFAPGETIVRMGEPGSALYVIRSGRVNVVREQSSGNAVVLAMFGPGEFFGELSIFDGERRSASVIAVEPTETVALGRFDVVRVVTHNPQVGLSLLKSLSARLRATDDQVVDSTPVNSDS
jgi:CRP/FNR family transcriptional regulator, cyclic AMP receptor protein